MPRGGHIGWLGHGSVLVELDGVRLLADPLLRRRVAHLHRHVPPVGALPAIDGILITHRHLDHLDLPSLARFAPEIPIVAPRAAAPLLRRRGFSQVHAVGVGDSVDLGVVEVRATPAQHDGGRLLHSQRGTALGFVVKGSRRIYLAGDTGLFPEMAELGPLDATALPVGGWGTTLGPGHLGPAEAAEAVVLLDPRLAVPIHYGTYGPYGMAAPSLEPAITFARLVAEGPTRCTVVVLSVGQGVDLDTAAVV